MRFQRLGGTLSAQLPFREAGRRAHSQHALHARLDRFLNDRSFAYAVSGLERNERRLLDLRSRLGGDMGWRLRSTGNTDL